MGEVSVTPDTTHAFVGWGLRGRVPNILVTFREVELDLHL